MQTFNDLFEERSTLDSILVGISKSSLIQVLVSQLDSLHILLFLDKHASIQQELVQSHLGLVKGRRSFLWVHKLLPNRINSNTRNPLPYFIIIHSGPQCTKEICTTTWDVIAVICENTIKLLLGFIIFNGIKLFSFLNSSNVVLF